MTEPSRLEVRTADPYPVIIGRGLLGELVESVSGATTGVRTVACGVGDNCSFPGGGAGPIIRVSCDQNADCNQHVDTSSGGKYYGL